MRQQFRIVSTVAATGLCVVGLSACGALKGESFADDAKVTQKVTSVRLDSTSGGVTLNGKKGAGETSVHRSIDYSGNNKPSGATHRMEGGVLVLGGCGKDCSVNYTVDLPAGLPVSGETSTGAVRLTDVGSVTVKTSTGRIEMDKVAGPVKVETHSGRITGTGIQGESIQAKTNNGAITLTPTTAQNVTAETSNGDVTITAPSAHYNVKIHNNNGKHKVNIPSDPAGKYKLDLTTSNGEITINPA
jgi:DUF4097 and DUF4098 domain-containing protein YvlB